MMHSVNYLTKLASGYAPPAGLEPAIFGLEVRRLAHYAKGDIVERFKPDLTILRLPLSASICRPQRKYMPSCAFPCPRAMIAQSGARRPRRIVSGHDARLAARGDEPRASLSADSRERPRILRLGQKRH